MDIPARRSILRSIAVALASLAIYAGGAGGADAAPSVRQQQSDEIWRQQDRCAQQAFEKFPDYTSAELRQRSAAMHACDAAHHLPPRADLNTSPVHRIPDADAQ